MPSGIRTSRSRSTPAAPNPFPYQGSKRRIAPEILRHLPGSVPRLVEPFAGSAALSIAYASRQGASRFWINDAHEPLAALWGEILDRPEQLASRYAFLWNDQRGREREYYDDVRSRFNSIHDPADFLYLLARCVKASVRYNANGEFNNTPDTVAWERARRRSGAGSSGFGAPTGQGPCDFMGLPGVLRDCSDTDLVYMDPPYQGVSGSRDQRYSLSVDHDRFHDELADLTSRGVMFAVSYDGRTGTKRFGRTLPRSLGLVHLEILAGRSTQATLLGRQEVTYESLYLSPSPVQAANESKPSPMSHQPSFL